MKPRSIRRSQRGRHRVMQQHRHLLSRFLCWPARARLGGRAFLVMTCSVGVVTTVVGTPAYAGPATNGASSGGPVSGVTMFLNPPYPTALAAYAVSFKATSAIPAGGDIFLSEAAGPTDFASEKGVRVSDFTQGWEFEASHVSFGTAVTTSPPDLSGASPSAGGAIEIPLKDAIKAGDSVSVAITGATNPEPGDISDFKVYTTSNPTGGLAAPYTIDTVAESMGYSNCGSTVTCYSPQAFRTAYNIAPLLARGIDGQGRTILIPDPADVRSDQAVTNIFQDLSAYDTYFHLPPVKLMVVAGTAAKASADLATFEEVMDVEMAHAVAPGAAIRVVIENTASNLGSAAVTTLEAILSASKGADVVSASYGVPEDCFTSAQLAKARSVFSQLAARHITVTAASGDWGPAPGGACTSNTTPTGGQKTVAKKGVSLPASDPLVLAVGGTTLTANPNTGAYTSEVAWNVPAEGPNPPFASGGGFSRVFARPSYQDGVPGIGPQRGMPDVAADANALAGLAVIAEFSSGDNPVMQTGVGTSLGAPFWASLVALADQYAGHDLGPVDPAIYRIAQSTEYHAAFHDITSGDNAYVVAGKKVEGYQAGPGWDPVTGWGTPVASVLVPLLARHGTS
jgi:subtilase family serine protease